MGGLADRIRLLLVEDNDADARLVQEYLSEEEFDIVRAQSLGAATASADVCLLDLNLPDSKGLDSLRAMMAKDLGAPIVVLTGLRERRAGVRAVEIGAQDFLEKGRFDADSLPKSLKYAVARHKLLEAAKRRTALRRKETEQLQSMGRAKQALTPEARQQASKEFRNAVQQGLEARAFVGERITLGDLGKRLGAGGAGPRDVVEILLSNLEAPHDSSEERMEAWASEARVRALELMGELASFYRGTR